MIVFDIASAEIKTKSADVLLKMLTILKELRITQLCSLHDLNVMNLQPLPNTHVAEVKVAVTH